MGEYLILAWFLLASLIGLNLVAAGVSALLHVWRPHMGRRNRVLLSATSAGLFPASMFMAALSEELAHSVEASDSVISVVVVVVMFGFGAAISLPLAIVVTRKLDGPGEHFRSFE